MIVGDGCQMDSSSGIAVILNTLWVYDITPLSICNKVSLSI
jgi:hypothetical protein